MKVLSSICLGAMIILLAACNDTKSGTGDSTAEKNKDAMKKVFEAFNSGNIDSLGNYIAEDAVEHTPDPFIKTTGIQAVKDVIAMMRTAYPNMKTTTMDMIAEGDLVVSHFNMKGTNSGPYGPNPATNKEIDINGVDVVRFKDGKAVDHWGYWEEGKMMTQLGLAPDMSKMQGDTSKMK